MKAKKKPLLVNFSESESDFIEKAADKIGVSKTAFIRRAIENLMSKK
jgi:hypothetical protein